MLLPLQVVCVFQDITSFPVLFDHLCEKPEPRCIKRAGEGCSKPGEQSMCKTLVWFLHLLESYLSSFGPHKGPSGIGVPEYFRQVRP